MTTPDGDSRPTLEREATDFADSMTSLVESVVGVGSARFVASAAAQRGTGITRLVVSTESPSGVPLSISEQPALELKVSLYCTWDHRDRYLAMERSQFEVRPVGKGEPLFRYDYEKNMQARLPCAHLQVHAHRDEFVYQLVRGGRNRRSAKRSRSLDESDPSKYPSLSNVHFPLGGHRFRPCLEDVLQMLIEEFGIDHQPDANNVLDASRVEWRRKQLAAAVRDAPQVAARVLQELDYGVTPPDAGEPDECPAMQDC